MTIRVALADDQSVLREIAREILELEGDIEVVGDAEDGRALLDVVGALLPDIAVVDIAMPGMDGIETAARLAEQHPAVRVVALSSHAEREYVLAMLEHGAVGYVVKFELASDLVPAVRAVADGQRYLCPTAAEALSS